jgi:hypothetical protein
MNHRAVKYAQRVESGICVRCGRNPRGKTKRCDPCNRRQQRYLHRSREHDDESDEDAEQGCHCGATSDLELFVHYAAGNAWVCRDKVACYPPRRLVRSS